MTNQRVIFTVGVTDYNLGTYDDFVSIDYRGNNDTRIIPRAKGVAIQGTEDLGGGELSITIKSHSKFDTRLALEQAVYTLIGNIANKSGTLSVESTLELTNCYIENFSMDKTNTLQVSFDVTFVKSL